MQKELEKEILDFLGQIVFTIAYRPTKDKAAALIKRIREEKCQEK